MPWLARYPNGGVRLFHPVTNLDGRRRAVETLIGKFWKHTTQHRFHIDNVGQKTFESRFPKYIRPAGSVSAALDSFLLQVERHCLNYGVYVPARDMIVSDARLGTLYASLPVHVQLECVNAFDLLLFQCFGKDQKLCADFATLFNSNNSSGYHVIYELAVAAQLPMLSLVGFEAVHRPPIMNDADTIDMYTERWKSWFTAADHLGWINSDEWFLIEYTRGLHKSLRQMGGTLKNEANANRRNVNSAYPARYSPSQVAHTFLDLICRDSPSSIDIRAIPARQLASSLPIESVFQFVEDDIPLAEGDFVVAAIEPGRPGRYC